MAFEIERRDDICIVHISGRISSGSDYEYLRVKGREIRSLNCSRLIVDIRNLDSIGSLGVGLFIELHVSTTKRPNGRFVLAGPSRRVLEVLNLTRLATIVAIVEDLPAALAYCASEPEKTRHASESIQS